MAILELFTSFRPHSGKKVIFTRVRLKQHSAYVRGRMVFGDSPLTVEVLVVLEILVAELVGADESALLQVVGPAMTKLNCDRVHALIKVSMARTYFRRLDLLLASSLHFSLARLGAAAFAYE